MPADPLADPDMTPTKVPAQPGDLCEKAIAVNAEGGEILCGKPADCRLVWEDIPPLPLCFDHLEAGEAEDGECHNPRRPHGCR